MKLKRYIGDKTFYKSIFRMIIPIMLQQLLLSTAGYVDSLMINAYGGVDVNDAYMGVSAANKLMFVMNFVWMAAAATAAIFISQYYGANNRAKIRESLRLSLYVGAILGIVGFAVIEFAGDRVVDMFIIEPAGREYGYRYLDIMKWGSMITAFSIAFASAFRSVKQMVLPMLSSIGGVLINVFLNYCLIFGNLGFPEMDSAGAALATVISRAVELVFLLCFALFYKNSPFRDFFKTLVVKKELVKEYTKRGIPLVFNELMWSIGTILFALFYAWKDDDWYNAYSYSQNITDLFFILFAGLGNGTAIVVGASLGAGDFEGAKLNADRMKGLSIGMGVFIGILMIITAPYISDMFQPNEATKAIMVDVLTYTAIFVAIYAYNATCFFILRAGGDSTRAFILDQLPTYIISIPLAALFGINAKKWGLTLPLIFLITHICDIIKIFMATKFVKMGKWIVNLAKRDETVPAVAEGNDIAASLGTTIDGRVNRNIDFDAEGNDFFSDSQSQSNDSGGDTEKR